MGAKCCSPNENNNRRARTKTNLHLAPTESEIDFPNYSSSHDKIFNIFESTYNLYKYIPFADYVSLLVEKEKARVAWWRADSLIQAVIKN